MILLNLFEVPGTHVRERLNLLISITGAQWAKEHLEYTLPLVDSAKRFASTRRLACRVKASGSLTTSLAMVFLDHFAQRRAAPKI